MELLLILYPFSPILDLIVLLFLLKSINVFSKQNYVTKDSIIPFVFQETKPKNASQYSSKAFHFFVVTAQICISKLMRFPMQVQHTMGKRKQQSLKGSRRTDRRTVGKMFVTTFEREQLLNMHLCT